MYMIIMYLLCMTVLPSLSAIASGHGETVVEGCRN